MSGLGIELHNFASIEHVVCDFVVKMLVEFLWELKMDELVNVRLEEVFEVEMLGSEFVFWKWLHGGGGGGGAW